MQIERDKRQHWHLCCTYSKSHCVFILTAVEMQITHAGDSICTAAAPLQLPERTAVLQIHYKCLLCILHSRKYFYTAECPANIHVYLQGGSLVIAARLLAYFHVTLHSFMGVLWKILLLYWDLDPYSLYNKNVFIGIRRRWDYASASENINQCGGFVYEQCSGCQQI